jgi:hypothetical protein
MNTMSLYLILAPSRTGIASNLEVCNAVHLANVLFLPVMYIWSDLQILTNLGLWICP